MNARAVLTAEITKIRTVRATVWALLLTFVVGVALSALLGLSFGNAMSRHPRPGGLDNFDPIFPSFYGLMLAQLALVVFGVLVVGGEYGSGTIRASLAAVPRRGLFYCCKLLAGALATLGLAVITVPVTFLLGQAMLGEHGISLGADGVPTAILGACLYLPLICLFAMGVATMLRSSVASLGVLIPVLFLGSQGLGNIPKLHTVTQYLPDQAGSVIMHLTSPGDPRFGRDYGPWTGMGILALWTAAALLGGYMVMRRRDA